MNLSRETRIYLALWRKAYTSPEETTSITVSSYSAALTMRGGMYRAIRPYRYGEAFDAELQKAAETYVISVTRNEEPHSPHQIVFKPRNTLTELEAEMERLGMSEEDLLLDSEKSLNKKLAEFISPEPDVPAPPEALTRKSNPFYTRED